MRPSTLFIAILTGIIPNWACASMMDTSADLPGASWCYLAKSTTVIGVPFQPDVTQITFDGALYTRHAELCFFYGDDHTPILARGKTFLSEIEAPPMLTADRRKADFIKQFGNP